MLAFAGVSLLAWLVAITTLAPSVALAHPDLDAGIAHAADADFEAALTSFDAALASGELTRGELITLFSERALVRHALGQREALARDLAVLAMLDPTHDLGRAAPPGLVSTWNDLRSSQGEPLSMTASCSVSATGTRIEVDVTGLRDPSLAQVFVHTRVDGGAWVQKQATSADIGADADEIAFYVDARGPGGVALVESGSASEPLSCAGAQEDASRLAIGATEDAPKRHKRMWWWIGAAGVAAAAITTGVVLLVNAGEDGSSSQTTVSKPMVSF